MLAIVYLGRGGLGLDSLDLTLLLLLVLDGSLDFAPPEPDARSLEMI